MKLLHSVDTFLYKNTERLMQRVPYLYIASFAVWFGFAVALGTKLIESFGRSMLFIVFPILMMLIVFALKLFYPTQNDWFDKLSFKSARTYELRNMPAFLIVFTIVGMQYSWPYARLSMAFVSSYLIFLYFGSCIESNRKPSP